MSEDLSGWNPRPRPPRTAMQGRLVRVEPFDVGCHAADLFDAYRLDAAGELWTWMGYGPFADLAAYRSHAERIMTGDDPLFHAIVDLATGRATGVASLLRITPEHGVVEVGHLAYAPCLQRTAGATEAMYLMARRVFDELGYRRFEWKCDSRNLPSRRAAERLGFRFEGVFRKHMIVKGGNRDTAWFAITDDEWPGLRQALERWLDPANFDAHGRQRRSLAAIRSA
ncbi:RimJ/RimL family protein N-acetyltransferase [Tepidamorphus gemmatus]|uniref:RimJ/RimL family protein N-acetyltransferase n=1 Tax=Tepidamorphus gemmatus TaxID=747076 RepID=A0A4R3M2G9_9HYPH|nr:GNAT family protein [Tepidamorphus gemmatus]TCT05427.1 RimJ/RimL family protein N-acetyltransferase [Tepidamorphus gemmatus]